MTSLKWDWLRMKYFQCTIINNRKCEYSSRSVSTLKLSTNIWDVTWYFLKILEWSSLCVNWGLEKCQSWCASANVIINTYVQQIRNLHMAKHCKDLESTYHIISSNSWIHYTFIVCTWLTKFQNDILWNGTLTTIVYHFWSINKSKCRRHHYYSDFHIQTFAVFHTHPII